MSATFVIIATGLWREHRWTAVAALLLGVSISGDFAIPGTCALAAIFCAISLRRIAPALAIAAGIILLVSAPRANPDGPHQLEAAASRCEAISTTQPRNSWLIVSPPQELPCAYGRGWHMELRELVSRFTPEQVAAPDFRFPFPVKEIFFFVERRPLVASTEKRIDVLFEGGMRDYTLPTARAGMQFLAADLLGAYASTHDDLQLYYSDPDLVIYRITKHQP